MIWQLLQIGAIISKLQVSSNFESELFLQRNVTWNQIGDGVKNVSWDVFKEVIKESSNAKESFEKNSESAVWVGSQIFTPIKSFCVC